MSETGNFRHGLTENSYSYDTNEDYELSRLILQMNRAMYRARAKELFQYGITPEEVALLFVVQAVGYRATPTRISRLLVREPHSVSSLLTRMQKRGLVSKVKDLERKNLVRVVITEKGRQAYYHSMERKSIRRILSVLSEEERRQLRVYMKKLRDKAFEELGIARGSLSQ